MGEESKEEVRQAMESLCEVMEPLCGFRPESYAQAISLLSSRLMDTMPALEALSALACALDADEKEIDLA